MSPATWWEAAPWLAAAALLGFWAGYQLAKDEAEMPAAAPAEDDDEGPPSERWGAP